MQGRLLKHCRQMAFLTQQEFAELVGVSQPLIAQIESGGLQPQPVTIKDMKQVLADKGIGDIEIELLASVFKAQKIKRTYR